MSRNVEPTTEDGGAPGVGLQLEAAVTSDTGGARSEVNGEDSQSEPESSDAPPPLSPHQRRLRRRKWSLVIAVGLGVIFIGVVIGSRAAFDEKTDSEVPTIAPSVLFDDLCVQIEKDQQTKLHVTEFQVDDAMLSKVAKYDWLETLILDQGIVTDEACKAIAKLPKLQHLRLRLSPIGDEGFRELSKLESLWYLNIPHAKCSADGVASLAAIPRLRQLRLGSTTMGNEVTREIATIKSLRGIHLIGVQVTDEGLKTLAAMPFLESLYLDDSAVTEAGWDWLFREHPHLHVHIDQSHHDRDPKAHLHH